MTWISLVEGWFVAGPSVGRWLLGPVHFLPRYLANMSSPTLRLAAHRACGAGLGGAASPLLLCRGCGGAGGGTGTEELFSHLEEGDEDRYSFR